LKKKSRRTFLKSGIVAAGALTLGREASAQITPTNAHIHASMRSAEPFDPAKEPERVRKSFYDLTDDELRNLCRAIGYMRSNTPLESPLNWENYARDHAFHCTEASAEYPAVHWSWNFLPWHRGDLYFLERILANILTTQFDIDGSKFALPYWDWSVHQEIPNTRLRKQKRLASPLFGYDLSQENMVNPDTLGFDNTALYDGSRGPTIQNPKMNPAKERTRDSREHVRQTMYYMSPGYVSLMLAAPFEVFGGKPVTDRQTGQGLLEQGPHNNGHDWVGTRIGKNRTMGTLRSAASDPIFYLHHANIDRIWSLYTQPQPDPAGPWGVQQYTFLDTDGSPIVQSVQNIVENTANVSYASSGKAFSVRKPSKVAATTTAIARTMKSDPITIPVPRALFGQGEMLLDIRTGPITHVGKYTVRIYAGKQLVGQLQMLDGENRLQHKSPFMTHTFSLLLTKLPPRGSSLTLVPPKKGFKILLKSFRYRPL